MAKKQVVHFKSLPVNYRKELSGMKNNTIREVDYDDRFNVLEGFTAKSNLWVEIENTVTHEMFQRRVTDVTWFHECVVISWGSSA